MIGLNFGVMGLWLMMFTAILLFFELRYRKIMAERDPFTKVQTKMTSEQFEREVASGKQYALLEDVIVDLAPYFKDHPGGAFVLRHNVGRNISKFFYGSYSLEGNTVPNGPDRRWVHSNYARKIVNKLIVAQLDESMKPVGVECVLD
jgi:cytochrome b involved in lipid metabolism